MGIQWIDVNWVFDVEQWAADLLAQKPEDLAAARELSGLTESAWRHWMKGGTHGAYEQPRMKNFLNVCNLLQLDPRHYFRLAD